MTWLFKEEPTHYSYDDLVRDGTTTWTGVKNPLAQKHLRSVAKDDRIFFYHTGDEKSVIGVMKALAAAYPDPDDKSGKLYAVDVAPVKKLPQPVTLASIKADKAFAIVSAGADIAALGDAGHRARVGAHREDVRRLRSASARPPPLFELRRGLAGALREGGCRGVRGAKPSDKNVRQLEPCHGHPRSQARPAKSATNIPQSLRGPRGLRGLRGLRDWPSAVCCRRCAVTVGPSRAETRAAAGRV